MQTPGLSHIIVTVSDLDRSRRFYSDVLGFQIKDFHFESGNMFYFFVGEVSVWFVTHRQTPPGDSFSEFRIGLDHLAFKATSEDELKAMANKLLAAGVKTNGVETFFTGNKYVAFRDPDNIQLEYWMD